MGSCCDGPVTEECPEEAKRAARRFGCRKNDVSEGDEEQYTMVGLLRRARAFVRRVTPNRIKGILDYYRRSIGAEFSAGPFNRQQFRQRIFKEILGRCRFAMILETGTYRGTTTEHMQRESRLNVHSVESDPRNYGFCRARFLWNRRIHVGLGDSRSFLRTFCDGAGPENGPTFIYLDAHWGEDLPLCDECEIILRSGMHAIIMIDDFEVPGDPGYGFDAYGEGKTLCLEYLKPLEKYRYSVFFPRCPSGDETGAKRGCAVIATTPELSQILSGMESLTEHRAATPSRTPN